MSEKPTHARAAGRTGPDGVAGEALVRVPPPSASILDLAVAYIRANDWVTYVELVRLAREEGMEARGDLAIEAFPNGILWAGVSQQFLDLINELKEDPRVGIDTRGGVLSYAADGGMLRLPIAKRGPRDLAAGYAKPHWVITHWRPAERAERARAGGDRRSPQGSPGQPNPGRGRSARGRLSAAAATVGP